jgi:hypothetical protein
MQACGQRAILVITRTVEGTSTSVARSRVELSCRLSEGHDGSHQDSEHGESWEGKPDHVLTLLRHEDEEPGAG